MFLWLCNYFKAFTAGAYAIAKQKVSQNHGIRVGVSWHYAGSTARRLMNRKAAYAAFATPYLYL